MRQNLKSSTSIEKGVLALLDVISPSASLFNAHKLQFHSNLLNKPSGWQLAYLEILIQSMAGTGGLLFAAPAQFLAVVGGLASRMRVCEWFPALVSDCLCMSHHHVSF